MTLRLEKRVFVVQNQHRLNDRSGNLEPKFDFSSAERYGELIYLLSPTARPFSPEHVISQLKDKLIDFRDEDCLLLIGNPCLIGFAVAVASWANEGRVRVLQWDGRRREYVLVESRLPMHVEDDSVFPEMPRVKDRW